jgi:hypothetical protein
MFGRKSQRLLMYEYRHRPEPITGLDAALNQIERRTWLWNRFLDLVK